MQQLDVREEDVPGEETVLGEVSDHIPERRDEAGEETWVTVEIGRSSNGRVEVSGQLAVDDEVVAP